MAETPELSDRQREVLRWVDESIRQALRPDSFELSELLRRGHIAVDSDNRLALTEQGRTCLGDGRLSMACRIVASSRADGKRVVLCQSFSRHNAEQLIATLNKTPDKWAFTDVRIEDDGEEGSNPL